MTTVIRDNRKSAVLVPSTLRCLSRLPTINLTAGCAHACLYCYARGYSRYPGEGKITLYANTLEKLRHELPRKRKRPKAVYFSSSSDPFQPVPEVLETAFGVFEHLLDNGVGVAFLTKGRIPAMHMALLQAHPTRVHAGIGLATLDRRLCDAFEPNAAPPEVRLRQAEALIAAGIPTQVRLDPILPGLTDDVGLLRDLMDRLGEVGVTRIAVSTAFMRSSIVGSLRRRLSDRRMLDTLLRHYEGGPTLRMHGACTAVTVPRKEIRLAIYARVRRVARACGIATSVCACKNGDIAAGSCHIAGVWPENDPRKQQAELFDPSGPHRETVTA